MSNIIRDQLKDKVNRLLMGPLNPDENGIEILEAPPLDTYLTGILWPVDEYAAGAILDDSEQENLPVKETSDKRNKDEAGADEGAPLHSVIRPSSIGITFHLPESESHYSIGVTGARYERCDSVIESEQNNTGKESHAKWKRVPFQFTVDQVNLLSSEYYRVKTFTDSNGQIIEPGFLEVNIRRRVIDNMLAVTATVINCSYPGDDRNLSALFQVCLSARVSDPDYFCARKPSFKSSDEDRATNALTYRYVQEYAVGHGIAAGWEPKDPEQRVTQVFTAWMPEWEVNSVTPEGHPDLQPLKAESESVFKASVLSLTDRREETLKQLKEFVEVYNKWIETQVMQLDKLEEALLITGKEHIGLCKTVVKRMADGVEYLSSDNRAWEAFCLANRAMDNQSKGMNRREEERKPLTWRPFQLAFLLLTLKSTTDGSDPDRLCMDLLWFPTGGGKTEAYLALTAFIIFYQRLNKNEHKNSGTVNVIMRYTLRLLTIQQFQRAAAMICAADLIRKENEERLGRAPISLGLWVGSGATPNRLFPKYANDEDTALHALEKERNAPPRPSSTPMLLLDCPLCGKVLKAGDYILSEDPERLEIICPNEACPGNDQPLPVHTVDSEIYKNRPSLIIATVDKFAQLPRNVDTGTLFGIPGGIPPSLIIQDELHLISGPLGTMCGLYETAIDYLCKRTGQVPKIVGSTATIGRARSQVLNLFNRTVLQFPPPALDARHSFFAEEDREKTGRLYVGITSSGRSPKFTLQAATAALLQTTYSMYEKDPVLEKELDPYWTAALYFNSLRELGGADFMLSDDIPRSMEFYANRLGAKCRVNLYREELTSRVSSVDIPDKLKALSIELGCDVLSEGRPLDAVLASNMISVGVDISRLGLMIINGQPKTTAEYIQSSSRVGRQKPGIILTVYNASRPRDLSHFEHFCGYHAALYRSVEATSVTPWSPRARDRALHAVLASMVRHGLDNMHDDEDAINWDPDDTMSTEIIENILRRAGNADQPPDPAAIAEQLDLLVRHWKNRIYQQLNEQKTLRYFYKYKPFRHGEPIDYLMRSAEEVFDDPMRIIWRVPNSMRNVEPSAWFTLWQ